MLKSSFTSVIRTALLTAAMVAANASLPGAWADDLTLPWDPKWTFNDHPEYKGAQGSKEIAQDGKSMTLSYDFNNGGSFVSAGRPLSDSTAFVGLEVTASGTGGLGISVVDSTGQSFIFQLGVPGEPERTFNVNLSNPSLSYGGAKDKVIHFPLKNINILVSKVENVLSGSVTITELQLKATLPAPAAPASP